MGAIGNLEIKRDSILSGMDSIVIRNYVAGIIGGCTLDMEGFADSTIKSGHVVIFNKVTNTYKPMPVVDGNYSSLPAGFEYAGVVVCTQPADKPFVGVMYDGEVNDVASPYAIDSIKNALKAALPKLTFLHD